MACFDTAYNWMMDNEDAGRVCAIVPDAPPGAHAISGINSAAFATDFAAIAALAQSAREPSVKRFYQVHFWNTWFDQLASDEVAKRVFDEAVNAGAHMAVKLLQEAIANVAVADMTLDGVWGPNTLQRANACNPDMLSAAFRRVRANYYRRIVENNPDDARYLSEWLARAAK